MAAAVPQKRKRRVNRWRLVPALALALVALGVIGYFAGRSLEKRMYRLAYVEEIQTYAVEFSLDPCLVAAVIHTESRGNASAVSPKGAVGLMQIMPATGAWIAEKLEIAGYTEAALTRAPENIRLGCWYLRYLIDRYGDETLALAAYNAGPGNVDKWLADERYSANGALTNIPFPETANYVVRVQKAYGKYMELYDDELDQADE